MSKYTHYNKPNYNNAIDMSDTEMPETVTSGLAQVEQETSDFSEEVVTTETTTTVYEVEEVAEVPTQELEETIEAPAELSIERVYKTGVLHGCDRLNLRENPSVDSKVIAVLNGSVEVEVDEDWSTSDFYKVRAAGLEGFCMKKFIKLES